MRLGSGSRYRLISVIVGMSFAIGEDSDMVVMVLVEKLRWEGDLWLIVEWNWNPLAVRWEGDLWIG